MSSPYSLRIIILLFTVTIVSEYDQEMPQSQITDKPTTHPKVETHNPHTHIPVRPQLSQSNNSFPNTIRFLV